MPVPIESVQPDRRLLRDDVFTRLRDAIVDGTFTPGEQLKDLELAEWLGVSRTPVREAIMRLAESGLVVAVPGRSTTVSTMEPRAIAEARNVVAAMHELAVRESMTALTDDHLDAMREANRRFQAAIEAGDVDAALLADEELHGIPVDVADNRSLAKVLDQFTPVVRRAERLRFATTAGHESVARHDELIRLCAASDTEAAAALAFDTWHSLPSDGSE